MGVPCADCKHLVRPPGPLGILRTSAAVLTEIVCRHRAAAKYRRKAGFACCPELSGRGGLPLYRKRTSLASDEAGSRVLSQNKEIPLLILSLHDRYLSVQTVKFQDTRQSSGGRKNLFGMKDRRLHRCLHRLLPQIIQLAIKVFARRQHLTDRKLQTLKRETRTSLTTQALNLKP